MQITKRGVARYVIAISCGVLLLQIVSLGFTLYSYSVIKQHMPASVYWTQYLTRTVIVSIPVNCAACFLVAYVYAHVLRPNRDGECRCRRCGYILKGVSKLECPECGEAI